MVVVGQFRMELWLHAPVWTRVCRLQERTAKVPEKVSIVVQVISPEMRCHLVFG